MVQKVLSICSSEKKGGDVGQLWEDVGEVGHRLKQVGGQLLKAHVVAAHPLPEHLITNKLSLALVVSITNRFEDTDKNPIQDKGGLHAMLKAGIL